MVARDIRARRADRLPRCTSRTSRPPARSSSSARRRRAGVPVTCEVTPHHLFLTEDDIDGRYDTNLKMNPPLRTAADATALLAGLLDGTVDCIATDHAPHAPHEKELEFELAPFGTTGLETALPLVDHAPRRDGQGDLGPRSREWMCHGPRRCARPARGDASRPAASPTSRSSTRRRASR